eukprot:3627318-Amphidinium_carterae.3
MLHFNIIRKAAGRLQAAAQPPYSNEAPEASNKQTKAIGPAFQRAVEQGQNHGKPRCCLQEHTYKSRARKPVRAVAQNRLTDKRDGYHPGQGS